MKLSAMLVVLGILPFAAFAQTEETDSVVPTQPSFERYEKLLSQSLFAPVTVEPAQEVVAESPLSSKYYVVGVYTLGDKKCAIVENRETNEQTTLRAGDKPKNDLTLVSVNWSPILAKSEVTIRQGESVGTLKFDQAAAFEPLVPQPLDTASSLNSRAPLGGGNNNNNNNNNVGPQNNRRRVLTQNGNGRVNPPGSIPPPRTFNPNQPNQVTPQRPRRIINAPPQQMP